MASSSQDGPRGGGLEAAFRRFFRRPPKQARSRVLVDALLEAFDEGVRADGDDVTIDDVGRRAGVGAGSFYEYFAGKDALVGAFVGHVTRRNFDRLAARLRELEPGSVEGLVRGFAAELADVYLAHPKRMRLLVDGISRFHLIHVVNRERDRFTEEVLTPRALDLMRAEDPGRMRETMRLIADAVMGILVSHVSRPTTPTVEVVSDELATVGFAILCARHPTAAPP